MQGAFARPHQHRRQTEVDAMTTSPGRATGITAKTGPKAQRGLWGGGGGQGVERGHTIRADLEHEVAFLELGGLRLRDPLRTLLGGDDLRDGVRQHLLPVLRDGLRRGTAAHQAVLRGGAPRKLRPLRCAQLCAAGGGGEGVDLAGQRPEPDPLRIQQRRASLYPPCGDVW